MGEWRDRFEREVQSEVQYSTPVWRHLRFETIGGRFETPLVYRVVRVRMSKYIISSCCQHQPSVFESHCKYSNVVIVDYRRVVSL